MLLLQYGNSNNNIVAAEQWGWKNDNFNFPIKSVPSKDPNIVGNTKFTGSSGKLIK